MRSTRGATKRSSLSRSRQSNSRDDREDLSPLKSPRRTKSSPFVSIVKLQRTLRPKTLKPQPTNPTPRFVSSLEFAIVEFDSSYADAECNLRAIGNTLTSMRITELH